MDETIKVIQSAVEIPDADNDRVADLQGFLGLMYVEKAEFGSIADQSGFYKLAAETL